MANGYLPVVYQPPAPTSYAQVVKRPRKPRVYRARVEQPTQLSGGSQIVEGQYREISTPRRPRATRTTYRVEAPPQQSRASAPPPSSPAPSSDDSWKKSALAIGKANEKRWKQEQKLQERALKAQARADAKMARRNRRPSAFARKNKRIAKRIWRRLI